MKLKLLFSILTLLLFSCKEEIKPKRDLSKLPEYSIFIKRIQQKKRSYAEQKARFFTFINEEMPYYWQGTAWDYNGVTQEPKKGAIACGYFVTTILEDFGIRLKRVFLAQQASSVMINQLSEKSSVRYFNSVKDVIQYTLERSEKEIYIVGLDFHTGFIIREKENVYFFHSSMVNNDGVIKELAITSIAFNGSRTFMIGSLSENQKLFQHQINP